jgi:serine/threonine-protein kinase
MIISKDNRQFIEISGEIRTSYNLYTIDDGAERLGAGGNAAVYECVDRQGNDRAIKFLLNLGEKARKRFAQEVDILLKLNHPHIIKCVDSGEIKGIDTKMKKEFSIPFLVMEKADMNIVVYMQKVESTLGYDVYAPQIRGLADALNHLHKIAVHRDIKPENVLVRGETWLLSDLGLCTAIDEEEQINVTKTQEKIGPKYWLSPEASDRIYFGTQEIDAASDVYQLCAVFWFIITRRYPLGIIEDDDYSSYDGIVCKELLKALKYNRDKRTQNGEALYECLCNATINREVAV